MIYVYQRPEDSLSPIPDGSLVRLKAIPGNGQGFEWMHWPVQSAANAQGNFILWDELRIQEIIHCLGNSEVTDEQFSTRYGHFLGKIMKGQRPDDRTRS